MKAFKTACTAIVVVIGLALCFGLGWFVSSNMFGHKPTTDLTNSVSVAEKLQSISELSTAQIQYRGYIEYIDGDIKILNKKSFKMIYDAKIKAGFDLDAAKAEKTGNTFTVVLPQPQVTSVEIDHDSIKFYDFQNSILNPVNIEDPTKALVAAEQDARDRINAEGVADLARTRAEQSVKLLFGETCQQQGLELKVLFADTETN